MKIKLKKHKNPANDVWNRYTILLPRLLQFILLVLKIYTTYLSFIYPEQRVETTKRDHLLFDHGDHFSQKSVRSQSTLSQIRDIQIGNSHSKSHSITSIFVSPRGNDVSFPRATQIALASVVRRVFSQKHRKNAVRKYKNKYFCEVGPPIFILGFKFKR